MTDILDDGLREQLAAALLGWGGGGGMQRLSTVSRDTIDSAGDDSGRATPKPPPGLGHRQGYIRGVVEFADDEDRATVDDDIDADSVGEAASEGFNGWSDGSTNNTDTNTQQARRITQEPKSPVGQKALPPLPVDSPSVSPQPEMSFRISRFPFSHPVDMPELMPDQDMEDMYGMVSTSPPVSGPVTPSVTSDVFRPLTQLMAPDLELGQYLNPAPGAESHDRMRKMSIKSVDTVGSDGLGIIREEETNMDGVSLLTPTEVSSGNGTVGAGDRQLFLTVSGHGHTRSVSSLASGSSGEWRPSHANATARKSINLFSRMRNSSRAEDPCLEKRSLTPMHLSTPPQGPNYLDEELTNPDGTSPTSPLPDTLRAEASTTTRFLQRMPWLGDSSKKSEAVFGVDLKESIRVAPMKIRISHKGRSTSYRTFPLAVHKCCEFIRRAGGTDGGIFSSPGNAYNVTNLQAIFSTPPLFGEQFRFEGSDYTVHDAARLILVYLEALPKPLISPSVVKSWILLARQEGAIEPPCPRVETGLDFWTEALNRLPTPNRNMTKHLLTLFAEVLLAAAGEITEADARQLASAVSRAIFHHDTDGSSLNGKGREQKRQPVRRNVHPTLALAFLIKKRGEYAVSLGQAAASNASKRDSKMFLPSTKEMMEWKGMNQ